MFSDVDDDWVSPCRCSGSAKWAHQACIRRWVLQETSIGVPLKCPQCKTPYNIIQQKPSLIHATIAMLDSVITDFSPFGTGVLVICMGWAGLGAYSLFTIPRVFGKDVMDAVLSTHPVKLYLTLPLFPITLWASRLKLRIRRATANPNINVNTAEMPQQDRFRPAIAQAANGNTVQGDIELVDSFGQGRPMTRVVLGALLLPYVAAVVGSIVLYGQDYSRAEKTFVGWLVYATTKEIVEAVHSRHKHLFQSSLRIAPFSAL